MSTSSRYGFRRATVADLETLHMWQSRPHVSRWWDTFDPSTPQEFEDPRVARWIVSSDGTPFAYMQDYTVHGWDDHHFAHLPQGARGVDQFIGRPDMTGQGHGPAFIAARVQSLFDQGAPAVATDPHPDNVRAIAAYRKVGFEPSGPPQETQWGRVLPMIAWRPPESSGASVV